MKSCGPCMASMIPVWPVRPPRVLRPARRQLRRQPHAVLHRPDAALFPDHQGGAERSLLHLLGDDPEFGDLNRTWYRAWTDKWLPKTAEALHDFLGIYAKVDKVQGISDPASIKAAVARVVNDWVADYANKIDFKVDADQLIANIRATSVKGD